MRGSALPCRSRCRRDNLFRSLSTPPQHQCLFLVSSRLVRSAIVQSTVSPLIVVATDSISLQPDCGGGAHDKKCNTKNKRQHANLPPQTHAKSRGAGIISGSSIKPHNSENTAPLPQAHGEDAEKKKHERKTDGNKGTERAKHGRRPDVLRA
ncbi:hypothetical protein IWX90DRAFT_261834 [Phyllosticta citrichinensis]|uniref:Uncharacterized protein n=1 Tax=Phyllosticta citrichinensis TaxID=1130410 RepID=A0ABR1XS63_9PEZI